MFADALLRGGGISQRGLVARSAAEFTVEERNGGALVTWHVGDLRPGTEETGDELFAIATDEHTGELICRPWLSSVMAKRPPGFPLGGRFCSLWPAGAAGDSVSGRRAVRLICAGWVPQDGLFGWNAPLV